MKNFSHQVGNTLYVLEDQGPMLKVSRTNSEGLVVLFFPPRLLGEFVAHRLCGLVNQVFTQAITRLFS